MYLPILKNPRFLLAGTSFVCVCVCVSVSKGFGLKAHSEDAPDNLVTCSLCQVGRGLNAFVLITSGCGGESQKHIQQLHDPVSC